MTSSPSPSRLARRVACMFVFVVAFVGALMLLERYFPFRGPAQLLITAAADPANLQANIELIFPGGGSHAERFLFDRLRSPDSSPSTLPTQPGTRSERAELVADQPAAIDASAAERVATATLNLPAVRIARFRLISLNEGRPLQVKSARIQVNGQTVDLPFTVEDEGITTVDLRQAGLHELRAAFHPLVLVGHILLALGCACFFAACVRPRPPTQPTGAAAEPEAGQNPVFAPALSHATALGPLFVGVSAGLQAMLAFLVIWGPYRDNPIKGQLTEFGQNLFLPEYDLQIYVAGCALTVLLCLAAAGIWTWWVRRLGRVLSPAAWHDCVAYSSKLQALLSALSLTFFFVLLFGRYDGFHLKFPPDSPLFDRISLLVLPAALLAVTFLELWRVGRAARRPGRRTWWRITAAALLDIALPLGIVAVVYIPAPLWPYIAGRCFADNFTHWSYFAMNPAVAYNAGLALGTDVYSQYGLGWSMFFVGISRALPLAYTSMISVAIVYSCLYYVGVYVFLRLASGSRVWAGSGALLCVTLQLFNGTGPNDSPWLCPSSTCLRHPFDIWFLIVLLFHLRSNRPIWSLVAGSVCGLSLIFETETGVYTLAVLFVYLVLETWWRRTTSMAHARRRTGLPWLLALGGLVVTAAGGFAFASRGTLFTAAFWTGFTECLRVYAGQGASLLPIAGAPEAAIGFFAVIVAVCLLAAIAAVGRLLFRQPVTGDDVLLACVAWYALGSLVLFVGRSHPFNLYHCTIPFVLTLVLVAERAARAWSKHTRGSIIPLAGLCLTGAWLGTNPAYLNYPSMVRTAFKYEPAPMQGVYLFANQKDVYLPATSITLSEQVTTLGDRLRHLTADGVRVAILDNLDTELCLASGCRPWSRYLSILTTLQTRSQLEDLCKALADDPPQYVVIKPAESHGPVPKRNMAAATAGGIVLRSLHTTIDALYRQIDTVGPFELWQLKQRPATRSSINTQSAQ